MSIGGLQLPVYKRFEIEVHSDGAVSLRWSKWVKRLENLFVALGINDKKMKRALLLHYAGNDVHDIFETLQNTGDDFDTANQKLIEYFNPKKTLNMKSVCSDKPVNLKVSQ